MKHAIKERKIRKQKNDTRWQHYNEKKYVLKQIKKVKIAVDENSKVRYVGPTLFGKRTK